MSSRLIVVAVAAVCAGILADAPAAAQTASKADVSGGYQVLSLQGNADETFVLGWWGELAAHVTPRVSLLFQTGGSYKTVSESLAFDGVTVSATADLSLYHFMGGARWRVSRPNGITPFAHVLFGGVRLGGDVSAEGVGQGSNFSLSSTVDETRAAAGFGGGVDIGLSGRLGVRAGGDYVRIFDDEEGINAFRFSVGAVWSL